VEVWGTVIAGGMKLSDSPASDDSDVDCQHGISARVVYGLVRPAG